jgi:hypothetical protein
VGLIFAMVFAGMLALLAISTAALVKALWRGQLTVRDEVISRQAGGGAYWMAVLLFSIVTAASATFVVSNGRYAFVMGCSWLCGMLGNTMSHNG